MTILRWTPRPIAWGTPWREIERLRNQMESLYESVVDGVDTWRRGGMGVFPALNLYEDDEKLYLTAELAGVAPEDIEMSVEGDNLTIRGERKITEAGENVNYHRREREAGFFRRVVTLPVRVDAEKIQASVKEGVLKVTFPKAVEAKSRQIKVTSD